jgi:hypothetical protein
MRTPEPPLNWRPSTCFPRKGYLPKAHNVAEALTKEGHWPAGEPFKRLSKFLGDHTRGIYGFHEPITKKEAERGIKLAGEVLAKALAHSV